MIAKKLLSGLISAAIIFTVQPLSFVPQTEANAAAKSRVSVHDPSIFKDKDGTYYVFGSHLDAARSKDLQNWETFTNGYATKNNAIFGDLSANLKKAFDWAGEDLEDCEGGFAVWAPDVIYNPSYINNDGSTGAYMMYFCTSSTYMRSVIAYAVSQNAQGPYEFVDTLIYSGFTEKDSYAKSATKNVNRKYTSTNIDELIAEGKVTFEPGWFDNGNFNNKLYPNAIDPCIYYDTPEGNMYMCYGSWSGGIFTLQLDPKTGQVIHPRSEKSSDGAIVDSYFGKRIAGGYGKSGEGPYIYEKDGFYYLWMTYGGLFSDGGYNMRVFRSQSPTGPFTDLNGNSAIVTSASVNIDNLGHKIMGNHRFSSQKTAYMACGHNSVFCDDDGQWYLLNHARFDDGTEYHELRVHQLLYDDVNSEPHSVPFEYSGDKISPRGYNEQDIAGEYEVIDHGTDTSDKINTPKKMILSADGSITGDYTGKWQQDAASSQMTMNINGKGTLIGYFFAMQDETGTGRKVMTFTGSVRNMTLWGAQTKEFTGTERNSPADYTNKNSKLIYDASNVSEISGKVKAFDTAEIFDGVPYHIINKNSGLALELKDGKTDAGTNIQQWELNVGTHNEWRLCRIGDSEYFKIVSRSNEKMAVTVDGNNETNGLNVHLEEYKGSANQQFTLIHPENGVNRGYYMIAARSAGKKAVLDVYESSTKMGGNVNQWEAWEGACQLWKFVPVYPTVPEGDYLIRQSTSDNEPWLASYYSKEKGEKTVSGRQGSVVWHIVNNDDGTCSLIDKYGDALTVKKPAEGAEPWSEYVYMSKFNGSDMQKLNIICNKDGTYTFIIDVNGIKCAVGENFLSGEFQNGMRPWEYRGYDFTSFVIQPAFPGAELKGDVNIDGTVSAADLVMAQKYLLGSDVIYDPMAGDLCEDGIFDVFDLVELRKTVLNGK